jgi:glutamine amidotransferase
MKKQVAVIDYGMGNLFSVRRACEFVGLEPFITSNAGSLKDAAAVILPGVGAFGDAMTKLKQLGLISPIKENIEKGKPFLGICLGFQLLMTKSEEFGENYGLNVFPGRVVRFNKGKVPQVGWNRIYAKKADPWKDTMLEGTAPGAEMYFVHSYYVVPKEQDLILSYTTYEGVEYCSSIQKDHVFACQFHPEKSAARGLKIYENFMRAINERQG